jgi:hypothetical protein
MKIVINTDQKKMVLRDQNEPSIFYNFDTNDFKFNLFFNRWLDLLSTIQKSELTKRDQKIHLWHIAAPKSGSTWLTTILKELLHWNVSPLIPSYDRREQEISEFNLVYPAMNNFVFSPHQHCRYSEATNKIIEKMNIKPILQYRNIFDTVISFSDHCNGGELNFPMAYMDKMNWERLDQNKKMDFIIDMIIPWYFNFYAGWFSSDLIKSEKILLISYEELVSDPFHQIKRIIQWIGIEKTDDEINVSIVSSMNNKTRKNVGILGRGTILSFDQKQRIRTMADYYPNIDFKFLGL